jgi:hypothetical protein
MRSKCLKAGFGQRTASPKKEHAAQDVKDSNKIRIKTELKQN